MSNEELSPRYEPAQAEEKWYVFWEQRGYFQSDPDDRKPFTIVIPPPNVTGALHMGHALNNTLQDILIRWRRMQNFNALWIPGTDHAGIATQAVVERRLLEEEGKTRHDLGRDALVRRIWEWKDEYEQRILSQLRRLGCSCDWRRTRFTLDPICTRAVRETFFRLFEDGLIYRGKRLVNWDTHLQTAVADDEIFYETVPGHLWVFRYPLKEPVDGVQYVELATTRPETMLGDTAVAVHPDDPRYKKLIGKTVILPLVNREIPIIADPILVDPEFGTGCVKVTPAHDPNDYECALRNGLPMINILNPDGTLNGNAGPYAGLDRYEARKRVVEDMEKLGLLVEVKDYEVQLAHSDRSKTPIEPYLSDQWFVRMATLAEQAMEAARDGRVKFHPERYVRTYLDWLAEKRDWCISRQLWWGHQIPVWTRQVELSTVRQAVEEYLSGGFDGQNVAARLTETNSGKSWRLVELADPVALQGAIDELGRLAGQGETRVEIHVCLREDRAEEIGRLEAAGYVRDPDVLDTWFSSALWPHSTLGWPERTRDFEYYYPTDVLVTSRDIITLWVARMVMMGLYNCGKEPFHDVYIHPKILDGFGQTMSKSKGNGVDPLDIIACYGTDALRFTLAAVTTETQDIRLPVGYRCPYCGNIIPQKLEHQRMKPEGGKKPRIRCGKCGKDFQFSSPNFTPDPGEPVALMVSDKFEYGRNFANKLWNAARFSLMNMGGYEPAPVEWSALPMEDRWILGRLALTAERVTEALGAFRFSETARLLYEFVWGEFCDWYLEMVKERLRCAEERPVAQRVLAAVLDGAVRLLHPIIPFVTEEIWQAMAQRCPRRGVPQPQEVAESVMISPWPQYDRGWIDTRLFEQFEAVQQVIRAVRNIRSLFRLQPRQPVTALLKSSTEMVPVFEALRRHIVRLASLSELVIGTDLERPADSAAEVGAEWELYVPLSGLIDRQQEIRRLEKRRDELTRIVQSVRKKLTNEEFLTKARPEVVEKEKERARELHQQLEALVRVLDDLKRVSDAGHPAGPSR